MADNSDGTTTVGARERPGIAEHMGSGNGKIKGQFDGEVAVRNASNAIGAK
jgi:hypothetical protein